MSAPSFVSDILPDLFDRIPLAPLYRTLAARFGWCFVWRVAHLIAYGESLPVRDEARRAA